MQRVNDERGLVSDEDLDVSSELGGLEDLDLVCQNKVDEKETETSVELERGEAKKSQH
jgi:hypothetical protein